MNTCVLRTPFCLPAFTVGEPGTPGLKLAAETGDFSVVGLVR